MTRITRSALVPPGLALTILIAGLGAHLSGEPVPATRIWFAGLLLIGLPVAWNTVRHALQGRFATDIVATLAILGAIGLQQPLAGLVVVLMQTGGEALERYAEGRASRAIHALEQSAPRIAHRFRGEETVDVPVDQVVVEDLLLVRPGELVPCDGAVEMGPAHLDLAALTGEPLPVIADAGTAVRSGSHAIDAPFTLRVSALASESEYAKIVELVRSAQASKAPLQRLADRYAVWFTPITLAACALTWFASHDMVRVLAVLVVATPCPLILATPVAIVGGISRAASRGIVFRHGTALEQLATVKVAVFDKTGTLTIGRPEVRGVRVFSGMAESDVLQLAAAVERGSGHPLARTLVEAAAQKGLPLLDASEIRETAGQGVTGIVMGKRVAVGGERWIAEQHPDAGIEFRRRLDQEPPTGLRAFVVIDDRAAGIVDYADRLRPDVRSLAANLRELGIHRLVLLSGDSAANAEQVAREVGMDDVHGDLAPGDKTAIMQELMRGGDRVLMLGDGTNDAPALSTATVGIALAAGGGGIAAEAADAVILADDPGRVAEAIVISRRTLYIARQSIWTGLCCSAVAMGFAARGALPPTIGALVQEGIDVAVILNALRAASAHGHHLASAIGLRQPFRIPFISASSGSP